MVCCACVLTGVSWGLCGVSLQRVTSPTGLAQARGMKWSRGLRGKPPPDGACGAVEVLRGTTGDQGEGNALCSHPASPCPWLQGQGAGFLLSPSSATRSGPWAGNSLGGLFATQGSPPAPLQGGFGLLGPAPGDGHRAGVSSGCRPRPLLAWGPRRFPWWVHRGGWDPLQHPQLREEPPLSAPVL